MTSEPTQRGAAKARRRAWRLGFVVLRLLVLFFSVELSGLAHAALDVCGVPEQAEHDDCDDEAQGHECPPGCATCHCWHAGTPAPPLAMTCELTLLSVPAPRSGFCPRVDAAPHGADPESLYRPPRDRSFLS